MKVVLTFTIILFAPKSAYAYFDPAVGSAILSAIGSALVGIIFYYNKIKNFCKKQIKKIRKKILSK